MSLNTFINTLKSNQKVSFDETMVIINESYDYTPTRFSNGLGDDSVNNVAGSNEGSCKIFAFAKLNQFDKAQTLNLFGDFYHQDVLNAPDGNDHQNIRNFMQYGWEGIQFSEPNTLQLK
ncbi:MAG: HopJ type III effector protein [Methyloprofundus sp.]|nr:HopJ type III effector protein [Methyloprofundus sp.]